MRIEVNPIIKFLDKYIDKVDKLNQRERDFIIDTLKKITLIRIEVKENLTTKELNELIHSISGKPIVVTRTDI